jgi:phage-related protein
MYQKWYIFAVMTDLPKKIVGRFYATAHGRRPVRDWLMDLTREDRRQIGIDIQRVEFGWPLGMPYCRSLGNGLGKFEPASRAGVSRG